MIISAKFIINIKNYRGMELTITNYNNFYKLKGSLNKNNLEFFNQTFQYIFEKVESLTISIDGLESVDQYGVKALVGLHNQSITKNKRFSIVGIGCKELYQHFKSEETAA